MAFNCSLPYGFLSGFPTKDNDFFGNKKELYQVIQWVSTKISLVHIKGKKNVGKTRFLIQLGKLFYERHKFPLKISYIDLLKVENFAQFKDLMDEFDDDLKASKQNEDSNDRSKAMLWLFDNAHSLSEQLWNQFEPKLSKICMKRSIYVVLTSIEDNLVFNNFEEEPRNPKILEKRELTLQELSDDESIRLFLSTYNRSILEEKCYPETVYSK